MAKTVDIVNNYVYNPWETAKKSASGSAVLSFVDRRARVSGYLSLFIDDRGTVSGAPFYDGTLSFTWTRGCSAEKYYFTDVIIDATSYSFPWKYESDGGPYGIKYFVQLDSIEYLDESSSSSSSSAVSPGSSGQSSSETHPSSGGISSAESSSTGSQSKSGLSQSGGPESGLSQSEEPESELPQSEEPESGGSLQSGGPESSIPSSAYDESAYISEPVSDEISESASPSEDLSSTSSSAPSSSSGCYCLSGVLGGPLAMNWEGKLIIGCCGYLEVYTLCGEGICSCEDLFASASTGNTEA